MIYVSCPHILVKLFGLEKASWSSQWLNAMLWLGNRAESDVQSNASDFPRSGQKNNLCTFTLRFARCDVWVARLNVAIWHSQRKTRRTLQRKGKLLDKDPFKRLRFFWCRICFIQLNDQNCELSKWVAILLSFVQNYWISSICSLEIGIDSLRYFWMNQTVARRLRTSSPSQNWNTECLFFEKPRNRIKHVRINRVPAAEMRRENI